MPQTPDSENIEGIEIRDDSIQELMSRPPRSLVRWGTSIVFLVTAILVAMSWWVQYPDVVRASVIISTPQPPVDVVARTGGNLNRLLVQDGQAVKANQRLAVLHSVADAEAVFELQTFLRRIVALHPDSLLRLELPTNTALGELQNGYALFLQHLDNYQLFLAQQTDLQQIPFLKNEITYNRELDGKLSTKDTILQQELVLAEQKVLRMKEALKLGGVSVDAVEQAESALLLQKRQQNDIALQRLQYQIRINDLEKQIESIRQRTQESAQGRYLLLKEYYQRLHAEVDTWISDHVLLAPIDGQTAFHQIWSERQYLNAGEVVMSIVPDSSGLLGRITLPVHGSGKVAEGQRVNIELLAYPRHEYGMLQGKIEKIALLAQDNNLSVEISLPKGMTTNYHKQLAFRPNMQGQAEIITQPRRLLQRILDGIVGGR